MPLRWIRSMCPLAQLSYPAEIDMYWSDEQIIQFLDECSRGSRLPSNVLEDSSPYQYPPAYLPGYLVYAITMLLSDSYFF